MIISLVRLPAEGLRFEHQYLVGQLDTEGFGFNLQAPLLVTGHIDRAGMDVRLRGKIKAELTVPCARCLKNIPMNLEISLDLLYSPADPGGSRTGEVELQTRDLDIALYQNDEIDLDEMVLEQLELNLPSRVLCSEDCRGLCPQCGADLNVEQCSCEKPVDPRWQTLVDFTEKSRK